MLVDGRCSIYQHRPRACRTYDCRVLPAAGVEIDGEPGKAGIARRARRWRFSYPTQADRDQHEAVRTAATFLRRHAADLPEGAVPATATGLALLAIELHGTFLDRDADSGRTSGRGPGAERGPGRAVAPFEDRRLTAPSLVLTISRRGRSRRPGLTRPDRSRSSRGCPRGPAP